MFLVPVVVVNVGAIEAVDHRGGAIKPLYGLEDFEGDAGAVVRGGEASRVDGEDDVRERRGGQEWAVPDFPDIVPGADVEGRGDGLPCGTVVCGGEFEGDVADAGGPLCDAQLAGARGHVTAILAAHMRDAGADPCLRRPRAPCFVACTVSASPCITVGSPEPNCATVAAPMFSPSHSSVVGSRVGHSGEGGERKLRSHREILISARTDKKIR